MPEFREQLATNRLTLDRPVWVDDPNCHVDRHLHRIGLSSLGGQAKLSEICGHIA
ncbi:wax ester/triacylglycerol synthase domain-containing protein [Mycobacterium lepromatosis]